MNLRRARSVAGKDRALAAACGIEISIHYPAGFVDECPASCVNGGVVDKVIACIAPNGEHGDRASRVNRLCRNYGAGTVDRSLHLHLGRGTDRDVEGAAGGTCESSTHCRECVTGTDFVD